MSLVVFSLEIRLHISCKYGGRSNLILSLLRTELRFCDCIANFVCCRIHYLKANSNQDAYVSDTCTLYKIDSFYEEVVLATASLPEASIIYTSFNVLLMCVSYKAAVVAIYMAIGFAYVVLKIQ